MGFVIVFLASIPAYAAGIVAFLMGAPILASLGTVAITGASLSLLLCLAVYLRDIPMRSDPPRDCSTG